MGSIGVSSSADSQNHVSIQEVATSTILGDVVERSGSAQGVPVLPPQGGEARPFPEAHHRKQSKVGMGVAGHGWAHMRKDGDTGSNHPPKVDGCWLTRCCIREGRATTLFVQGPICAVRSAFE